MPVFAAAGVERSQDPDYMLQTVHHNSGCNLAVVVDGCTGCILVAHIENILRNLVVAHIRIAGCSLHIAGIADRVEMRLLPVEKRSRQVGTCLLDHSS